MTGIAFREAKDAVDDLEAKTIGRCVVNSTTS